MYIQVGLVKESNRKPGFEQAPGPWQFPDCGGCDARRTEASYPIILLNYLL